MSGPMIYRFSETTTDGNSSQVALLGVKGPI